MSSGSAVDVDAAVDQISLRERARDRRRLVPDRERTARPDLLVVSVATFGCGPPAQVFLRVGFGGLVVARIAMRPASRAVEAREVGIIAPDAKNLALAVHRALAQWPTQRAGEIDPAEAACGQRQGVDLEGAHGAPRDAATATLAAQRPIKLASARPWSRFLLK